MGRRGLAARMTGTITTYGTGHLSGLIRTDRGHRRECSKSHAKGKVTAGRKRR
jgi:hypothetical protein